MNHDRAQNRKPTDDGYVLVITAISIVVMLGFSAVAVDLGAVYNLRRQDQSAADIGALGAAQDLGDDTATVMSSIALVNSTLDNAITAASFNTCAGEYPVIDEGITYTPSDTANCISFDRTRRRVRVRVPLQQTDSTFGGVVGVDNYEHTAFAIAEVSTAVFGGILPFALKAGAGTYECLKAGASNVPSAICSTNYSGNFGFLNIGVHGDESLGTTPSCDGQGTNRLAGNIAVGIDHQLSIYGGGPHYGTRVIDTDTCGDIPRPNSLGTLTGNIPDATGKGLFSGENFSDGDDARLRRSSPDIEEKMTIVSGYTLDDNPLWDFIPKYPALEGANVPDSCKLEQFIGETGGLNVDNDLLMTALPVAVAAHLMAMPVEERTNRLLQRCFSHYIGDDWDDNGALIPPEPESGCIEACSDPVFSRNTSTSDQPDLWDIQYTPRFGYVPQMTSNWPSGSSSAVDIKEFRAVFLQRLFAGDCNPQGCASQFDPGVGYSDSLSSNKASAITTFVFPDAMLPGNLGSNNAPNEIGVNLFISLKR